MRGSAGGDVRTRVPVNAVADPEALGVQDLVVIAVKAPALAGVAERIAPLIGADTIVLVAMNGVPWWFLEGGFGGPITGHRLAAVDPTAPSRAPFRRATWSAAWCTRAARWTRRAWCGTTSATG